MKEVFSSVVVTTKSPEEILNKAGNPELLGKFLVNDVPDTYLSGDIKKHIKYGKSSISLDVPGFKSRIDLAGRKSDVVKYNINFPGLKEGVIYVQTLPTEDGGSKVRLAAGYSLGLGPAGLLLRSVVTEDKVKETLDDIVTSLVESFDVTEKED